MACSTEAQTVRVISSTRTVKSSNAPKKHVDVVNYRITYNAKMANDTTKTPYIYAESQMRLDIGTKATHFYDYTKQQKDSIMRAKVKAGDFDFSDMPKGGRCTWEYYKNYPTEGQSTLTDVVGKDEYQCIEPVETPNWQLIADSTATIMGYNCQMAQARFKGRTWYAWYAEDIPLQEGPWKLCGLPGLVLRAYDEPRQYVFEAAGMSNEQGRWNISFTDAQRETISQKELRKAKQNFDVKELISSAAGNAIVKRVDSNGNVTEGSSVKDILKRKLKTECNPIELE